MMASISTNKAMTRLIDVLFHSARNELELKVDNHRLAGRVLPSDRIR